MWQANINKKQHEKLKSVMAQGHELHILVMNVEAFSTEKGKDFAMSFLIHTMLLWLLMKAQL